MQRLWRFDELDLAEENSPLISRFTIAVLSALLTGMTFGYALSAQVRVLTGAAAALGLVYYVYRSSIVRDHLQERSHRSRAEAERRLQKVSAEYLTLN